MKPIDFRAFTGPPYNCIYDDGLGAHLLRDGKKIQLEVDVIGCWSVVGCGSSPLPRKRKTTLKCFGGSACGSVQKVPDFPITNDSSYVAMWESFDVHVSCFGMYLGYLGEAKTNRIYLPPVKTSKSMVCPSCGPKTRREFFVEQEKVPRC